MDRYQCCSKQTLNLTLTRIMCIMCIMGVTLIKHMGGKQTTTTWVYRLDRIWPASCERLNNLTRGEFFVGHFREPNSVRFGIAPSY